MESLLSWTLAENPQLATVLASASKFIPSTRVVTLKAAMLDIFHKAKSSKNLVLFIHGLQGNESTWLNAAGNSFPSLLLKNAEIKKKCDFGFFNYYTSLLSTPEIANKVIGVFRGLLKFSHNKVEKNLHINEIADLLSTYLEENTNNYDSVVLICHSMGGLVSKSLIVNHSEKKSTKKIKLIVSLAVPHNGSHLATLGEKFLSNVQIKNLRPLSDDISQINHLWVANKDHNPKIIYFQGKYDTVVTGASAVGYDATKPIIKSCDEDHESIAKPQSKDSLVCTSVRNALLGILNNQIIDELGVQEKADLSELEKEDFVIKLIIADVHESLIANSKQRFYDAERGRKILIQMDMKRDMDFLYSAIEQIYKDAFAEALAGKIQGGGL